MRRAFTLIELLVVITIIGIMAAMTAAAVNGARNTAKEAATKATIAKLHNIIMQRMDSYKTRRIGFDTSSFYKPGLTPEEIQAAINAWDASVRATPLVAARYRLDAIRDLMRMEMPDAKSDIENGPIAFSWGKVPQPALHKLYASKLPTAHLDAAQCLYKTIAQGSPEDMEQFRENEIGRVDGNPVFVDGWGNPIMWLRWAPGYVSELQPHFKEILPSDSEEVKKEKAAFNNSIHDSFDVRKVDAFAFHLVPLIYSSAGRKKADGEPQYGIDLQAGYIFAGNPYGCMELGQLIPGEGGEGCITNHSIESK